MWKTAWQKSRIASVAFLLAVALSLFFAVHLLVTAPFWMGPRPEPGPVAGWMTPRFLIHAYDLPPEVLAHALGFMPERGNPQTLKQIAQARGVPLDQLIGGIEAEIEARHPDTPPNGGTAPEPAKDGDQHD